MNKHLIAISVVVIALAGFVFGIKRYLPSLLSDQTKSSLENEIQDKQENLPVVSQEESLKDLQAEEIVLEASEFKYNLQEINLKRGEKVKLTLKNVGKMPHDFVIDELGVRTKLINGGETDTIEFIPEKTGNFEFYCSVGNHRQLGMMGKVVVE